MENDYLSGQTKKFIAVKRKEKFMTSITHYCQGQCAKCGSDNLDYQAQELQDNSCYYPYVCQECGHVGKEWYSLSYVDTE